MPAKGSLSTTVLAQSRIIDIHFSVQGILAILERDPEICVCQGWDLLVTLMINLSKAAKCRTEQARGSRWSNRQTK